MQTPLGISGAVICVALNAVPAQGQNVAACVQMQSSLQRLDCYDRLFRGNLVAPVETKMDLKPVAPPKTQLPAMAAPPQAQPPIAAANQEVLKTDLVTNSINKSTKFQDRDQPQPQMKPKPQQNLKPPKQVKPSWGIRDEDNAKLVVSSSQQMHRNIVGRKSRLSLEIVCKDNTTSLQLKFGGNIVASALDTARVRFSVDERPAEDYLFSISSDFKSVGLWSGEEAIPVIKTLLDGSKLTVEGAPYFTRPVKAGFAIQGLSNAIQPVRGSCNW
ncbi:MAG: hypothetical protein GY948_20810 [Alphaproteobacteria bacterium]|nr:hypothetical protein [Alphaproteobacteria bacterium]